MLSDGSRMVLLSGGFLIFLSGGLTLWSLRFLLRDLMRSADRPEVEAATVAFRSYRKAIRGADPNETREIESVPAEDDAGTEESS